jgi:succinate dehydrogenase/fumarate reductase flavoprotein subunit
MAALYASKTSNTAVISKLYLTRRIPAPLREVGAALGNVDEDHWDGTFDTVKGSDYLGDQMRLNSCVMKPYRQYTSSSIMACHFRTAEGK